MKPALTLSAVLCLLLLAAAGAAADSDYPSPANVRITYIPQLNNEEQVFICPTDSNIIIANWRDFRLGYRRIGIGRSTDGGQTWSDSLIPTNMMYFTFDAAQSDPTMTVDRFGSFYMSVLDYDNFGGTGQSTISFYRSDDKGVSWVGPYSVLNHTPNGIVFEDKQFITVDRTGGLYDGNLYVAWARFYDGPNRILFARSTDGGVTFSDTLVVGPSQTSSGCGSSVLDAGQFANPIVGADGSVNVFWMGTSLDSGATCSGYTAMKQRVSHDGGQTFGTERVLLPVSGYTNANGGINTYSEPVGEADMSGGPFHGNLYLTFCNWSHRDYYGATEVQLMRSPDNGTTWEEPITVNDDELSTNNSFHPWMSVTDEGVIALVFYSERYDIPNYQLFDLMAAYSFDGGRTVTTNHRITTVSSSPGSLKLNDQEQPYETDAVGGIVPVRMAPRAGLIGEYIGVTTFHDKINAVWTDSRDGNSEVYTANWYLPTLEPRLFEPLTMRHAQNIDYFSWATSWKQDQDRYRLEIATDSFFTAMLTTYVVDTPFVQIGSQFDEGTYYWRVKTLRTDGSDSSAYSEWRWFKIDRTPPTTPTLLDPPNGAVVNDPNPTFSWTDIPTEYPQIDHVEVSVDSTFPGGSTASYPSLPNNPLVLPDPLTEGVETYWRVTATDGAGNSSTSGFFSLTYINYVCGDVDNSGGIPNISDLTYLVAYLFQDGTAPPVMPAANVDGAGEVNVADVTYLVAYLFQGGPPPIC